MQHVNAAGEKRFWALRYMSSGEVRVTMLSYIEFSMAGTSRRAPLGAVILCRHLPPRRYTLTLPPAYTMLRLYMYLPAYEAPKKIRLHFLNTATE